MKKAIVLPGGGSGASDKRRVSRSRRIPPRAASPLPGSVHPQGDAPAYTAYDSATSTDGSITIAVRHSNYHGVC